MRESNRGAGAAKRSLLPFAAWAAVALSAGSARASGAELLPGGNQSVARGGAVVARPEDPMVLLNDPAGLGFLEGNRILIDFALPLHHMCVDPYGYYGWGVYSGGQPSEFGDQLELDDPVNPTPGATYASTPLPEVCNSASPQAFPQIAWSGRLSKEFALGAGIVLPIGISGMQYGGDDGTIQTAWGPRPTPTRYSMVKQEVVNGFGASLGAAYRMLPELSVGLTGQVFLANVRARAIQNSVSGTQPSTDWKATVQASDYFVPALIFSLHARPVRPVDMVVGLRWSDGFDGSGEVKYETNTFYRGAQDPQSPIPYENDPIVLKDISLGLPWQLNGGVRYSELLPGEGKDDGDPMDTELWDVEVDVGASFNNLGSGSVAVDGSAEVETRRVNGTAGSVTVSDIPSVDIDRHLKTSYTARLGGSFAALPRKLAIHAGGFYETRGVEVEYVDIDNFAMARVGLGAGLVVRFGNLDVRLGYSHIFSETIDLAPPPHQNLEDRPPGDTDPTSGFDQRVGGTFDANGDRQGGTVLADPTAPAAGKADGIARKTQEAALSTNTRPNRVINAGKYTARFDVVSVGLMYRF